jgi:hypothetical protein
MKQSKRIELSAECIKYWAKKAIDDGTNFKQLVEAHLEDAAKPFMALQKPKRARAKSKQ